MRKILFILLFIPVVCFSQITVLLRMNGDATDASGNGNNGTASNMTYVAGKYNQCGSFNGTSSKITLPQSIITGLPFTVSCWFYTTSTAALHYMWSYSLNGNSPEFRVEIGTVVAFLGYDNGAYQFDLELGAVTANKWYFFTGVVNTNDARSYLNGDLVGSDATVNITHFTSNHHSVGDYDLSHLWWTGFIDQFMIDNTAWTSAKAKTMYIDGLTRLYGYLLPLYELTKSA